MLDDRQLDVITDPYARDVIRRLLNLIETLSAEVARVKTENLNLRDEINQLKGEQGRPKAPPPQTPTDLSSEAERRGPRGRVRQPKNDQITIDRTATCVVDPATRPADAVFKGHAAVIVQDLKLQTDNVQFFKEKWYVPSTGKTALAPLPPGYTGQFGPHLRSLVWLFANAGQLREPKILAVVRAAGMVISAGHLSNLLIHAHPVLAAEAHAVAAASLGATPWRQVDHTPTRVNGTDQACHIHTTPLATVAYTLPRTDRLTTLDGLRNGRPRQFGWNATAAAILTARNRSATVRRNLAHLPRDQRGAEPTVVALLDPHVPNAGRTQRAWMMDAMALAAYQPATDEPVIQTLLTDDAPQFAGLCATQAGCWVHDGRHYTKLRPRIAVHYAAWIAFRTAYGIYYRELRT